MKMPRDMRVSALAVWNTAMFFMLVLAAGCTSSKEAEPADTGIVTSFGALSLIVQPVAGDVPVSSLLPAGVSPHAYSPRPSETARLHRASLIVHAHPDIDGWIAGMTSATDVALFAGVQEASAHRQPADDSDGHGHLHDGTDPHLWTDPSAVRDALPRLTDAMCSAYPDRCAPTRRQAAVFAGSLQTVEDSLAAVASAWQARHPRACFITAQPFMDRFLERFGFTFIGPISPSPDVEASPTSLSRLLSQASDRSCQTLIVQEALENRMERRLAADQGWAIVSVDPLGSSAPSYAAYLGRIMQSLIGTPDATAAMSPSP